VSLYLPEVEEESSLLTTSVQAGVRSDHSHGRDACDAYTRQADKQRQGESEYGKYSWIKGFPCLRRLLTLLLFGLAECG
jgi:hypothetical protein